MVHLPRRRPSAMCTVALYSPLRDFSTIWQGPHKTSRGLWKICSSHWLQSTHCATFWILPLNSIITLYTIFGCRWLWEHLMRTYMVTYSILFIQSHLAVTIVGFFSGLLEAILWISITNRGTHRDGKLGCIHTTAESVHKSDFSLTCELCFVPVVADHSTCNLELVSVAMTERKYCTIHLRQLS